MRSNRIQYIHFIFIYIYISQADQNKTKIYERKTININAHSLAQSVTIAVIARRLQ